LALDLHRIEGLSCSVGEPTAATTARLREWYLNLLPDVKRFLARRYRLPRDEVEDICQALFVRLIEYGDGRSIDNPRAYLLRAAINVLQNMKERARHRLPHEPEWIEQLVADSDEEPEHILQRAREISSVSGAISLLNDRQRSFVELHFELGLSYKEIAFKTHVSPRTVLRELTRAYAQLRQTLEFGRKH
jgi:RNA polymerase sigma-70 factor (ECF subfamily)